MGAAIAATQIEPRQSLQPQQMTWYLAGIVGVPSTGKRLLHPAELPEQVVLPQSRVANQEPVAGKTLNTRSRTSRAWQRQYHRPDEQPE